MNLFLPCPPSATLTPIAKKVCDKRFNQVVKLVFGIIGTDKPFAVGTPITAKASWDALLALDTAVVTNYVENFVIPGSDSIEEGGETNINRMPELIDGANVQATWNNRGITAAIQLAMKKLTIYSAIMPGVSELGFMAINVDGDVIHDTTEYWIPVFNLFTGDIDIKAEKGKANGAMGKFSLLYGWSDNITTSTPAFKILNTYPAA